MRQRERAAAVWGKAAPSAEVSVNFKGQIRENGALNDLNEVWFLEKPVDGRSGWRVAGIKQAS